MHFDGQQIVTGTGTKGTFQLKTKWRERPLSLRWSIALRAGGDGGVPGRLRDVPVGGRQLLQLGVGAQRIVHNAAWYLEDVSARDVTRALSVSEVSIIISAFA